MPAEPADSDSLRVYPAMSHPCADPAVNSVAARLAGKVAADPAGASILDIGCGSGHHLLALASRWPAARCTGVDACGAALRLAEDLAAAAGLGNTGFHNVSLADFRPRDGPFDFIIAHGFFSWVPDPVKSALFAFCERHLSARGIAVISFNVEAGWMPRLPVIGKTRAIRQAGDVDEVTALQVLRTVTEDAAEIEVIDDMLAKGAAVLSFDDFAPVNDPWPLDRYVRLAAAHGLRWLGESDPARNRPQPWSAGDEAALLSLKDDPLAYHHAADLRTARTFRSAMFCRDADGVAAAVSSGIVFDFAVRRIPGSSGDDAELIRALDQSGTSAVPMTGLAEILPGSDRPDLARRVLRGVADGWLEMRSEPVEIDAVVPSMPRLNRWRQACAARGLPLTDAWLRPCAFPARHYDLLALMDGTRTVAGLEREARVMCPGLDFQPWIRHLVSRGIIA